MEMPDHLAKRRDELYEIYDPPTWDPQFGKLHSMVKRSYVDGFNACYTILKPELDRMKAESRRREEYWEDTANDLQNAWEHQRDQIKELRKALEFIAEPENITRDDQHLIARAVLEKLNNEKEKGE